MSKIETLHADLITKLDTEMQRAGNKCFHYKFVKPNQKQWQKWNTYRNAMIRSYKMVTGWDIDEFRYNLSNNHYQLQSYVFGQN